MNDFGANEGHKLLFHPTKVFTAPECVRFSNGWNKWRAGKLVPTRVDVDLQDVVDLLPQMLVVEIRSVEIAILRLAGTAFREHFGIEITGLNFIDMAPAAERPKRGYRQRAMSRYPCGSRSVITAQGPSGKVSTVEIAAFPVQPFKVGDPPHLFAVAQMLQHDYLPSEENGDLTVPGSNEFCFLDIGAGLPIDYTV